MPKPSDFLPISPKEGPPIPRALADSILPPTDKQLRYIAILCNKAGIKEPLEEQVKTRGEAGRLISELKEELKRRGKS